MDYHLKSVLKIFTKIDFTYVVKIFLFVFKFLATMLQFFNVHRYDVDFETTESVKNLLVRVNRVRIFGKSTEVTNQMNLSIQRTPK
jgi:hypothetical protein